MILSTPLNKSQVLRVLLCPEENVNHEVNSLDIELLNNDLPGIARGELLRQFSWYLADFN